MIVLRTAAQVVAWFDDSTCDLRVVRDRLENSNLTEGHRLVAIQLHCRQGQPAPQPVVDGWQRYLTFSPQAQTDLWTLVAVGVAQPEDPRNQARIEELCSRHELPQEDAVMAAQACGFLLSSACAANLAPVAFRQDLTALSNGTSSGSEAILSRYDSLKTELRKVYTLNTVSDHGKLFLGLDWRVDRISASHRGVQLDTDVIFLTLRYREAHETGKFTIQFTPEGMKELGQFMQRFEAEP